MPVGVVGYDQREFPCPAPFLDQFFARDGGFDFLVALGVDEAGLVEVPGVLRAGAELGLVNVPDVMARLSATSSYIDEALLKAVFERWMKP